MHHLAQLDRVLLWCIQLSIWVTLAGMIARKRYRACLMFGAYLVVVAATDVAWTFPRFYTRQFWVAKELVINALMLGLAIEIGTRTLRAFPGARATARWLMTIAIVLAVASLLPVWSVDATGSNAGALQLLSRLVNGTVWLFTALAAVVLWYRLPIEGFQKAILVGLVPVLVINVGLMNLLESRTAPEIWRQWRPIVNLTGTVTYLILVTYWARAAWKPQTETVQARERQAATANVQIPL